MRERVLLIDSFPLILKDLPDFLESLENYYKWGKKGNSPSNFLRNWETQSIEGKYYFLGWVEEAMRQYGVVGNMAHRIFLNEKRAISKHIQLILEEATPEQKKCFERGADELYRKR